MAKKTAEDDQRAKIEKFIAKFGGSPTHVWAVAQMGSGFCASTATSCTSSTRAPCRG